MENVLEFLKIKENLEKISSQIEELEILKSRNCEGQSKETTKLFEALAKAQGEMKVAEPNSTNPYFKSEYADLKAIIEASRPALSKYGLAVIQHILPTDGGQNIMHTKLCHSSGQWIESRMRIVPPKNDIQTLGSYITYLRRYTYAAIVGCVVGDEDDDGETAMEAEKERVAKGPSTKYSTKKESYETITKEQLEELEYELRGHDDLAEEILDRMRLHSLADMPKSKFLNSIKRIREIKIAREGK